MRTTELFKFNRSSKRISESLQKNFGTKINFEEFDTTKLEDARNKLRTQIHTARTESGFNENLENDTLSKAQFMHDAIVAELMDRQEHIVDNSVQESADFDEQAVVDLLKKFDEDMNEIGGYGDPDYDRIMAALRNGDIESAIDEVWNSYSDQDGGELRNMDSYIQDLESEISYVVQGSDDEGGDTDDSYALASAGHGSDEDYGYAGHDEGIEDVTAEAGMYRKTGSSSAYDRDYASSISGMGGGNGPRGYDSDGNPQGGGYDEYPNEPRKPYQASSDRPKLLGYYFYDVKPGQEDQAAAYDVKKLKSGKWAMAKYNTSGRSYALRRNNADKAFGPGKWWAPKNENTQTEKFDPLKHVKNPTPGEKAAAKDVKRGSYADRAAMLKSAETDGRLKKESINTGEDMRNLKEGEIQQASAIVTAKTMVDRVGRWIEELSGMENDTLLQLGDSIRDEMGQEQAKGFIEAVAPAIQQALENLKSTREALASGVRTLTGEEQSAGMLGAEPGAAPEGDMGGEMGPAEPDMMNAEPTDDFAAAEPAAGGLGDAGREQRESIQRSSNLLRVLAG
jgi:hypothetical protein